MGHRSPWRTVIEPKKKCEGCAAALEKEGEAGEAGGGLDLRKVGSICELGPGISGISGRGLLVLLRAGGLYVG